MNQKTTYEQLITEKLEGMPVPDMADAIWARIENQLDIDMPTDDGGTDPEPRNPSGGGWVGGTGLFVFVVALVTIFFINKNQRKRAQTKPPVQIEQKANNVQLGDTLQKAPDRSMPFESSRPQAAAPGIPVGITPTASDNAVNKDTTALYPPMVTTVDQKTPDTVRNVVTVTPPPVSKQDSVKPKRTRGVPGITNDDYRIVPVDRDSAKGQ